MPVVDSRTRTVIKHDGQLESEQLEYLRRLGKIIKSWTPRTGLVEIRADLAVVALLQIIDGLEERIAHLENPVTTK